MCGKSVSEPDALSSNAVISRSAKGVEIGLPQDLVVFLGAPAPGTPNSMIFTPPPRWTGFPLRCTLVLPTQRSRNMLIHAAEPLFARGQLEDCPTLTLL